MKFKSKTSKLQGDGLHNTLLVDAPEPSQSEELPTVPQIDPHEDAEIEAKIGEAVTLGQRLRRKSNRFTLIAFFLILTTVAVAAYFIRASHGTLSITTDEESEAGEHGPWSLIDTDFVPSFKMIKDLLFFEGYYWAAVPGGLIKYSDTEVKFYGGRQGINGAGLTSLASTGDRLWVSYQGGVAKYNSATDVFTPYFQDQAESIINPRLFYDKQSEILFLATLEHLYTYSTTADAWFKSKDKNAPENGNYFVATVEGVFIVDEPLAASGTQILKYNRSTKLWTDVSPAQIKDPAIQLIDVDGELVALGSAPNNIGKTSYLHRIAGGWQSIQEYDNISRDAHAIPGPQTYDKVRVRQTISSGYRIYELSFAENRFSYERLNQTYLSGPIDDELFSKERSTIASVSGLEPYYEIYGFDSSGRMYLGGSDSFLATGVEKIMVASKSFINTETLLTLPEGTNFVPIFCNIGTGQELRFAFAGQYESELSDEWHLASLYRREDGEFSKVLTIPDTYLQGLNGEVDFVCVDDEVYWLADNYLWKFDDDTEKISKLDNLGEGNITGVNDDQNIFIYWDANKTSNEVKRLVLDSNQTTTFDLGRPVSGANNALQRVSMAGGLIWLPSLRSETLYSYNLDGVIQQSFLHDGIGGVDVLEAGGQVLVLQYFGEEVQLARYSFINPATFETADLLDSQIPGRLSAVPVNRPLSAYDHTNEKVWVSRVADSVFAIELP